MNNNFKFLVTCQNCNSTNVEVFQDMDWDSCGQAYVTNNICCKCHNCGIFDVVDIINQPFSDFSKKESK